MRDYFQRLDPKGDRADMGIGKGTLVVNTNSKLIHATEKGSLGVPIFFVISGYCILATLDKSQVRGDSIGNYFFQRFRRIYPPYWIALAVSIAVIAVVELLRPGVFVDGIFTIFHPMSLDASQWFGNATLTESWRWHVAGSPERFLLPHVWTLCYEEQFYAVAGLILFVAPRRKFTASIIVSLIVVVTMVASRKLGFSVEGTFLDGRWLLFAAGILVYYGVNDATPRARTVICVILATALVAMIATGSVTWQIYLNRNIERFTAIAFALVLLLLHRWDEAICRRRFLAPLFVCGAMCYSLYLVHALVTKGIGHAMALGGYTSVWQTLLVTLPMCVVFSLVAGWTFHVAVERRFLNR